MIRRASARSATIVALLVTVSAGQAQTLPRQKTVGSAKLDLVHAFNKQMPVSVAVTSTGRMFIGYPRWEDSVAFTLGEIRDGREVPYPYATIQRGNKQRPQENFVSLQGILVDARDRLWVLDTGTINMKPLQPFVPKLVCIDTQTNKVVRSIRFGADVAPSTAYFNDLRIDLGRGDQGTVYITDSSAKNPGIVVVDIASGRSSRRLSGHPSVRAEPGFVGVVEGRAFFKRPKPGQASHVGIGADGIAVSANGGRLFYTPLASRRLFSVSTDALADPAQTDEQVAATVRDHGEKGVADGMEEDTQNRIYTTNWEQNAVLRRHPNGLFETVVHDPRLLWPDTLDLARNGYLYVISNQLHRQGGYNEGRDRREKPFALFRIKVDARPVLLP